MADDAQSHRESPARPPPPDAMPPSGSSGSQGALGHGRRTLAIVACVTALAGPCLGVWAFSAGAASVNRQTSAQQPQAASSSSSGTVSDGADAGGGAVTSVDGLASGGRGYWQLEVNDRPAAASTPVAAGDRVECDFEDFN